MAVTDIEDGQWFGPPEDESWPLELPPLQPDPLAGEDVPWPGLGWPGDDGPGETWPDDPVPPRLSGEQLARMHPGLELTVELERLDPAAADEYELVEMVAGYQRIASWAQSQMTHLAGHLSRRPALNPQSARPGDTTTLNVTAEELAPRLGISRSAAKRMVELARAFRLKLEDTAVALHQGLIDYPKACVLLRMLADQPGDVAWEVQQQVLPNASHQTITQLEKAVAKAIISVDPDRATARARKARETRRVGHPRVLPDGMASMYAVLPATDAAGLDLALEAAARAAKAAGDTRTLDQLRADALALLGHGALERGFIGIQREPAESEDPSDDAVSATEHLEGGADDPPSLQTGNSFLRTPYMPIGAIGGQRAQVHVTVPLSVLLPAESLRHPPEEGSGDSCAHDEQCPPEGRGEGCAYCRDGLPTDWYPGPTPAEVAELDGYGPITPDVARALAYSAETWFRLVTDPLSGQLLDVGRRRYRPPAAMAHFVQLRDKTCVSPTCPTAARSCQLDHVVPWQFGGVTSAENLGPDCARDHRVRSTGAFGLEHEGGGTFVWTTPSGHRYRRDHTGRITQLPRADHGGGFAEYPPF